MLVSRTPCPLSRYSFKRPSLTRFVVVNSRPSSSRVLNCTDRSLVCVDIIGLMLTRVYVVPSYATIAATAHVFISCVHQHSYRVVQKHEPLATVDVTQIQTVPL